MSVILVVVLLFFLLGAAAVYLLARNRAAFGRPQLLRLAAITTGLALVAWLVGGRRLPMRFTLIGDFDWAAQPLWELAVDDLAWQQSFWLLLAAFVVFVLASYTGRPEDDSPTDSVTVALLLTSLGASLLAVWAGSLSGLAQGWALLAVLWTLLLWRAGNGSDQPASILARTGFLLIAQFCLFLARANSSGVPGNGSDMSAWPASATGWLLLAIIVQMGIFPLHWWRPWSLRLAWPVAPFIHLLPAVVGVAALARLVMTSPTGTNFPLFITAFGLLGLLYAVSLAWTRTDRPGIVLAALALAQVSVIILVATWADTEAIVAEVRVLLLGLGGLFVTSRWSTNRPIWMFAGPMVAAAALAGLPLTAGFNGRMALYTAWLAEGRIILLVVSALLYVPLVAAITLFLWPKIRDSQKRMGWSTSTAGELLAWLLLTLGLLAWPEFAFEPNQIAAVGFIVLAAIGGIVLSRYVGQVREVQAALQKSFHIGQPIRRASQAIAAVLVSAGTALREAAAILEGEGGLLWLLLLLAILLLAQNI